jgi:hypothetical protein
MGRRQAQRLHPGGGADVAVGGDTRAGESGWAKPNEAPALIASMAEVAGDACSVRLRDEQHELLHVRPAGTALRDAVHCSIQRLI